jgi:hypothetical protein
VPASAACPLIFEDENVAKELAVAFQLDWERASPFKLPRFAEAEAAVLDPAAVTWTACVEIHDSRGDDEWGLPTLAATPVRGW